MKNKIIAISFLQSILVLFLYNRKKLLRYFYALDTLPHIIGSIERKHAQLLHELQGIGSRIENKQGELSEKIVETSANQTELLLKQEAQLVSIDKKVTDIFGQQRANKLEVLPFFKQNPEYIGIVQEYEHDRYSKLLEMFRYSNSYRLKKEENTIYFLKKCAITTLPIITENNLTTIPKLTIPPGHELLLFKLPTKQSTNLYKDPATNTYHFIIKQSTYNEVVGTVSDGLDRISIHQKIRNGVNEIKLCKMIPISSPTTFTCHIELTRNSIELVSNLTTIFTL
jgi:hypothetical protein